MRVSLVVDFLYALESYELALTFREVFERFPGLLEIEIVWDNGYDDNSYNYNQRLNSLDFSSFEAFRYFAEKTRLLGAFLEGENCKSFEELAGKLTLEEAVSRFCFHIGDYDDIECRLQVGNLPSRDIFFTSNSVQEEAAFNTLVEELKKIPEVENSFKFLLGLAPKVLSSKQYTNLLFAVTSKQQEESC